MSKERKKSKGKKISKEKKSLKVSQFGFSTPVAKQKKIEAYELYEGKKGDRAIFTKDEIDRMTKRATKYQAEIDKVDVGIPISNKEWNKIEKRHNWEVFTYIDNQGHQIKLLATHEESKNGYGRANPFLRKKEKDYIRIREGQHQLEF